MSLRNGRELRRRLGDWMGVGLGEGRNIPERDGKGW
jgi:hypothetical protein